MKKSLIRTAAAAVIAAFTLSASPGPAGGQQLPDSIFDNCPPAFGNTLNDVPPDIGSIETVPAEPAAGAPVKVRAVVMTDPVMSILPVIGADLTYETGGAVKTVPMKLVDKEKYIWEAEIPAQKAGAVVNYGIAARDEGGNAVAQLVNFPMGVKAAPFDAIADPEDGSVEGSVDLTGVSFKSDGEYLDFCETFRLPFRWTTFRGAAGAALGFYPGDVRGIPTHSVTENVNAFVAYVPLLEIEGIVHIEEISRKGGKGIKTPFHARGKRVCGRARISDLTAEPERGLKMFAATVTYNLATDEFALGDATPYAIVYFSGKSYTVR